MSIANNFVKNAQRAGLVEGVKNYNAITSNIHDWNNQPDTLTKIDKALHKYGYLGNYPDFHVDSVDLIRLDSGPTSSLSAFCDVWASNGEEDLQFTVHLSVNRKGEFK